ncbi:MAG: MOSC domain-containing protein, partial [Gemmatimonadaceae bacterium]|nr:MOSC domain-containing protein [Gemmatimonadaceae bacterium]
TTAGVPWAQVVPGTQLQLGATCVLEITSYTEPCRTIRHAFAGGDSDRIAQERHPGWSRVYARVITPGEVSSGDPITVLLTPAATT